MLEVKNLSAGYNGMKIINNISIKVEKGELVTIVGPNGSGKSTFLRALVRIIEDYGGKVYNGKIEFDNQIINDKKSHNLLHMGIAFVPDGGKVFPNMTVLENLEMGGFILHSEEELAMGITEALKTFPILNDLLQRKAKNLSGGERQILSIAKALITIPDLLILDEPSAGLSPNYIKILFDKLKDLKINSGILIVEQNAKIALEYSDRGYVIRNGEIASEGRSIDLLKKENIFKLI